VWWSRNVLIEPVLLNLPVAGSKTSAVASVLADVSAVWTEARTIRLVVASGGLEWPPETSTRPSCRRVAVWNCRASCIGPVAVKAPVRGS
jgi:hypothetical protein